MNRILTAALFVLTLSAPALADTVSTGASDSQQRTARKPQAVQCYQAVATGSYILDTRCIRKPEPHRVGVDRTPYLGDGPPNSAYIPGGSPNQ